MKQTVEKEPKMALCRVCRGTGYVLDSSYETCVCTQCEGSGRVIVSMRGEIHIRPYRDGKQTK